jgi:hypothetical protein
MSTYVLIVNVGQSSAAGYGALPLGLVVRHPKSGLISFRQPQRRCTRRRHQVTPVVHGHDMPDGLAHELVATPQVLEAASLRHE